MHERQSTGCVSMFSKIIQQFQYNSAYNIDLQITEHNLGSLLYNVLNVPIRISHVMSKHLPFQQSHT